ncbi:lipase secretion chaperone [uncultured Shewanella sp.]|uniref:lipase secretion chaperone n=1 Tax=uncultured Shewanella sp. TaxID=173975 RepID=UPI002610328A|nr:lipase secretion chaperone [uncultured Shewanella sp.]
MSKNTFILLPLFFILIVCGINYLLFYLNISTDKKTTSTQQNQTSDNHLSLPLDEKILKIEAIQHTRSLNINRHLRDQFDDIIFTLQFPPNSTLQSIDLLFRLAETLTLSAEATQDLLDLFERYKLYKQTIATIKQAPPRLGEELDLDETYSFIREINKLQARFFNKLEVDAFFSHDNQYTEQTLERLAIRQDISLNQIEKNTLLQHHISQLSQKNRRALQPTLDAKEIATKLITTEIIDLNMNADIVSRARETQEINLKWNDKVNSYIHLTKNNQQEIEKYLNEHFTQNEVKRLKVFLANPELLKNTNQEQ